MMMLSAHDTISLLPRFQHIVLFRKQTFRPILFVTVCRSGHVGAIWAGAGDTHEEMKAERRSSSEHTLCLTAFPDAVIECSDETNLKAKASFWLMAQEFSPPG